MQEVSPTFFLVAGLLCLTASAFCLIQVLLPLRWRKVPGKIIYSDVSTKLDNNSEGGSTTLYSVTIRYNYKVEHRTYTSEQVSRSTMPGMWSSRLLAFTGQVKRYPIGAEVVVYVNPHNPNEAVLQQFDLTFLILFIVTLIIAVYCFYIYVYHVPIYLRAPSETDGGAAGGGE